MAAIGVLGPLRVVDADQRPIDLPPRSRRLLAALTVRANRTASPDWLAEAIWADDQPVAPAAALQTLISRLRNSLGRTANVAVVTDPGGYRLELARDALDLSQFEDLLRGARQPDVDPARAVALIDAALLLWRGAAYAAARARPRPPARTRAAPRTRRCSASPGRGRAAGRTPRLRTGRRSRPAPAPPGAAGGPRRPPSA